LDTFGIIDIGEYQTQLGEQIEQLGQIAGYFSPSENFVSIIAEELANLQQEDSRYEYNLESIKSINFEAYPQDIDNEKEIIVLGVQIQQLQTRLDTEELQDYEIAEIESQIQELQEELDTLEKIDELLPQQGKYNTINIKINGTPIVFDSNKKYNLLNCNLDSSTEICNARDGQLIVVNYIAMVSISEKTGTVDLGVLEIQSWGQVAGGFCSNSVILNNYNYNRDKNDYLVYNEESASSDDYTIWNSKNYILISSTNILEVIKQKVRKEIEDAYQITFTSYRSDNDQYSDGSNYYTFTDVLYLEIEANEGTQFYLNDNLMTIGATEKYIYTNTSDNNEINSLKFVSNKLTFASVNYKCKSILKMKGTI
jgi:hypothetical protein